MNTALALEAGGWLALRAAPTPAASLAHDGDGARRRAPARRRRPAAAGDAPDRAARAPLPAEAAAALDLRSRDRADPPEESPGVLAPWSFGHTVVALLSGRPVVVNGFGTYLDAPAFWDVQRARRRWTRPRSIAWMARRRVGYLVTGAATCSSGAGAPGAFAQRRPAGWSSLRQSMRSAPDVAARHRGLRRPRAPASATSSTSCPIFASAQLVPGLAFPAPVRSGPTRASPARASSARGDPGARVVLEIPFRERGGRTCTSAWGDVGAGRALGARRPAPHRALCARRCAPPPPLACGRAPAEGRPASPSRRTRCGAERRSPARRSRQPSRG